jgi:hypothetical protein
MCTSGTCYIECTTGKCDQSFSIPPATTSVQIDCNDQCDNININCYGAESCEVTCTTGCNNLVLSCGADGPCKLTCTGNGCANATVNCGGNKCDVACATGSTSTVHQVVGPSCEHTKVGCL